MHGFHCGFDMLLSLLLLLNFKHILLTDIEKKQQQDNDNW